MKERKWKCQVEFEVYEDDVNDYLIGKYEDEIPTIDEISKKELYGLIREVAYEILDDANYDREEIIGTLKIKRA